MSNSRWINNKLPMENIFVQGPVATEPLPYGSRREWRGRQRGKKVSDTDLAWRCGPGSKNNWLRGRGEGRSCLAREWRSQKACEIWAETSERRWAWHNGFEEGDFGEKLCQEDWSWYVSVFPLLNTSFGWDCSKIRPDLRGLYKMSITTVIAQNAY